MYPQWKQKLQAIAETVSYLITADAYQSWISRLWCLRLQARTTGSENRGWECGMLM